jgi:hypothetical protein
MNTDRFFLILFSCLLYFTSLGQSKEVIEFLGEKIINADSIILISHRATREYGGKVVPDWDIRDTKMNLKEWYKQHPPKPPFLIKGNLNTEIILENYLLSIQDRPIINRILLRPVNLDTLELSKCDQPAHSILIFHNKQLTYLDLCFGCKKIHTSDDININESNLDEIKWKELKEYFKEKGLTKLFKGIDE